MKSLLTIVVCTLAFVAIASSTFGASTLECGKEYRFVTKDGVTYQGSLWDANDSMLILNNGTSVYLAEVETAFRIKRHKSTGALLGGLAGTAIGILVAKGQNKFNSGSRSIFEAGPPMGQRFGEGVAITLGGTLIGALFGTFVGHNAASVNEIKIGLLPDCGNQAGEAVPLGISLSFNF